MSDQVRAALVRSDSLLSLLRHRLERTIPWGSPGLPTLAHVDEVIGQARAALAAATPGEALHVYRCRGNATSDPPVDCDAPFCDCNPAWGQAIAMLQECGWGPRPTPTPETVERVARALFGFRNRNTLLASWDEAPDWIRDGYREMALTALRAVGEGA